MISLLADACNPSIPGCKRDADPGLLFVVAVGAIVVALLVLALIVVLAIRQKNRRRDRRSTNTPPGWFADPLGRFPLRYWDGIAWTPAVTDGTSTGHDPMP